MSSLDKKAARAKLEELQAAVKEQEKYLERLDKAPLDAFKSGEPSKGMVLRFTRKLGGGELDYTFVATKTGSGWYVAGKKNTLQNMLHLSDGPNTWEDLVLAMSGATVIEKVSSWETVISEVYTYYAGFSGALYRGKGDNYPLDQWSEGRTGWWATNIRPENFDGKPLLGAELAARKQSSPEAFE